MMTEETTKEPNKDIPHTKLKEFKDSELELVTQQHILQVSPFYKYSPTSHERIPLVRISVWADTEIQNYEKYDPEKL